MSRITLALALLSLHAPAHAALAQEAPVVPEAQRVKKLPRQKLSGPRFGFTTFTGNIAAQRQKANLEPIMTQFGWQWETRILSLTGGNQALMEWVLLVGGVEQDEFNTSLGWLTGYRLAGGMELGVGPNFSITEGGRQNNHEHGGGGRGDPAVRRLLRPSQFRRRNRQERTAPDHACRMDHGLKRL